MVSNAIELIVGHYEKCWDGKAKLKSWPKGPTWHLPRGFQIAIFSPSSKRQMWTYATAGMSQQGDAPALELHLFSPVASESHVELLTAVAHYHLTGAYLDVGHTVNFGQAWLPGSKCDHGLISLPYLDGPKLEWLEHEGRKIRFLWLIPITAAEVEYKKRSGLEALETRLEASNFNYLDSSRESVA